MITSTQTSLPTIITLHDAITDSPIYRASTKRFDLQIDSFIEWFEDLSIQTKSYAEKLKSIVLKYNYFFVSYSITIIIIIIIYSYFYSFF